MFLSPGPRLMTPPRRPEFRPANPPPLTVLRHLSRVVPVLARDGLLPPLSVSRLAPPRGNLFNAETFVPLFRIAGRFCPMCLIAPCDIYPLLSRGISPVRIRDKTNSHTGQLVYIDRMAKQLTDLQRYALLGAQARLRQLAEETANIYRTFPQLRTRDGFATATTSYDQATCRKPSAPPNVRRPAPRRR